MVISSTHRPSATVTPASPRIYNVIKNSRWLDFNIIFFFIRLYWCSTNKAGPGAGYSVRRSGGRGTVPAVAGPPMTRARTALRSPPARIYLSVPYAAAVVKRLEDRPFPFSPQPAFVPPRWPWSIISCSRSPGIPAGRLKASEKNCNCADSLRPELVAVVGRGRVRISPPKIFTRRFPAAYLTKISPFSFV